MARNSNPRLGRYRPTPPLGRAFHIETPPDKMPLHMGLDLIRALDRASHGLGRLVGTAGLLPSPQQFIGMYVRLEAVLSSRIEGTRTSLLDLLQFEDGRVGRRHADDTVQVANHLKLLRLLEWRRRSEPLTVRELEAAHRILLAGTRGVRSLGKLRTVQNWIGTPWPFETVVFVPPPPAEVRPALEDLVRFINKDKRFPPIIKAAIAHAYFETIHPFADGNGRIGRYLIHFVLWKEGAVDRPILYLSHYIRAHQAEYYAHLQACRDAEGLGAFALFLANGVDEVAEEACARAKLVLEVRRDYEAAVRALLGRRVGLALKVLEVMYDHPIADVGHLAKATSTSRNTVNKLVDWMVAKRILVEVTGQRRHRRFALDKYLELFTVLDEETPSPRRRGP